MERELWDEIVVDNFAGGGGASTGIKMAIGRDVDIAINHDPAAIAMHKANHPYTEHYNESVWDIDPVTATGGRPVGLCWFSPDCKHFSKAKGGKPVDKNIRGLAWVALKWAATVRPRVIMLENVEEFKTWGPLLGDRPDPNQKGRTFNCFVNALRRHGYQVDWRELRACDYGAPTIRKRFFLIARCDGRPIVWPKPTHGDPSSLKVQSGELKPWHTAAECIDWSIPCPSIFERKKPLAENTLRRIAKGLQKFVIDNPQPFIVQVNHGGENFRGADFDKPFPTVTAKHGIGLNTLNTQSVIVACVVSVYRSTAAVKNIKAALTAGRKWTVLMMADFRMIVCRECGAEIFFIRTSSGAKMPVNKDQVGYTLGGKDRIVTPNGEILSVTITDHPESGLGYVPHWSTCNGANRARKVSPVPKAKKKNVPEESLF